jgi:hypothetical protein
VNQGFVPQAEYRLLWLPFPLQLFDLELNKLVSWIAAQELLKASEALV